MKLSFGKHHWIAMVMGIALLVLAIPYIKNKDLNHFDFSHGSQVPPKPVVQWLPVPVVSISPQG